MSDRTTTPTNRVDVPYAAIPNDKINSAVLQRAWCLMLVRSIWPTVDAHTALMLSKWLWDGRTS